MTAQAKILSTLHSITQPIDWDAIYTLELPRIYNFFLYKVGDRDLAQDLTATVFERAWKSRSRYRNKLSSPSTWLFGIARNVLKEHLRKNKRITQKLEPLSKYNARSGSTDIEQSIHEQQDKELLKKMLLELSERERDLIALKYGAGITNREIATITGLSESNVGTILHRAVQRLRKKWSDYHG
jgi:RNA polymerase sigma-70 factor (ECF subfamily)